MDLVLHQMHCLILKGFWSTVPSPQRAAELCCAEWRCSPSQGWFQGRGLCLLWAFALCAACSAWEEQGEQTLQLGHSDSKTNGEISVWSKPAERFWGFTQILDVVAGHSTPSNGSNPRGPPNPCRVWCGAGTIFLRVHWATLETRAPVDPLLCSWLNKLPLLYPISLYYSGPIINFVKDDQDHQGQHSNKSHHSH